jgi:hypothetical protein
MRVTDEEWKEILETDAFAKSLTVWIELRRERLSKMSADAASVPSVLPNDSTVTVAAGVQESVRSASEPTPSGKTGRTALTALRAALAKHYGIELNDEELSHVLEQTWARIGKPTRAVQ